jgi:hypothetical protein
MSAAVPGVVRTSNERSVVPFTSSPVDQALPLTVTSFKSMSFSLSVMVTKTESLVERRTVSVAGSKPRSENRIFCEPV